MPLTIAGVTVTSNEVIVVILTKNADDSFTVNADTTFNLQSGEKPAAYNVIHGQFADYILHNKVECICIKGSAVNKGGVRLSHFESAELRGVIQAAAASRCDNVKISIKASVSKKFGDRNVDEYLKDNSFWVSMGLSNLLKGHREAALFAINACKD